MVRFQASSGGAVLLEVKLRAHGASMAGGSGASGKAVAVGRRWEALVSASAGEAGSGSGAMGIARIQHREGKEWRKAGRRWGWASSGGVGDGDSERVGGRGRRLPRSRSGRGE